MCARLVDCIVSGFQSAITAANEEMDDAADLSEAKHALMRFAFLLEWVMQEAELQHAKTLQSTASTAARGRGRGRGTATKTKAGSKRSDAAETWDWPSQRLKALEVIRNCLSLRLHRILETAPEVDTMIGMLTKPAYRLLEDAANLKSLPLKAFAFQIIGVAVKQYNHSFGAQTNILQNLQYYDHLSIPLAELVHAVTTELAYPQLAEAILA
jgi:condensin complex subunit 1